MKYLILMLLMGVCGSAFAQVLPVSDFTKTENILIEYPNNVKVLIQANPTVLLLEVNKYNLDSLVKLASARFDEVAEGNNEEHAVSVVYTYPISRVYVPQSIDYKIYKDSKKKFSYLEDDEIVRVKTEQDTLRISISYDMIPNDLLPTSGKNKAIDSPLQLNIYFIVNSLTQLKSFDFETLEYDLITMNEIIEDKVKRERLMKKPTMPLYFSRQNGQDTINWNNQVLGSTILTGGLGVGWVRENVISSIQFAFEWDKGKYGFGFGTEDYIHFSDNPDAGFSTSLSTFANATIRFNKLESRVKNGSSYFNKYVNTGRLTVGFLVRNEANYFTKNTMKLAYSLPVMNHITIEGEMYFENSGKVVYPGIRLRIN